MRSVIVALACASLSCTSRPPPPPEPAAMALTWRCPTTDGAALFVEVAGASATVHDAANAALGTMLCDRRSAPFQGPDSITTTETCRSADGAFVFEHSCCGIAGDLAQLTRASAGASTSARCFAERR